MNAKTVTASDLPEIVLAKRQRRSSATLVVGADGARSLCRAAAGIEMTGHRTIRKTH